MKYTGQFRDINENLFTVNIVTDNSTATTKTVTLGTTPFVTEIETSEDHIYKPVKYSMATVRMINDDYSFDLYSAEAQENKVTFLDNTNTIRWIGYTTPNLYSQGYENEVEEIEIECIDALATLQYYKYQPINGTKAIVKFITIINYMLEKCNAYSTYYISNNIKALPASTYPILENIYISEQDFFDEDDEPMTMQEVLEEVCQYMGLSCVADGDAVYFLDYDAIKNGINEYYQYTVGDVESGTLVTLSHTYSIDGSDYVENGGQISLDNVYNKITVKDSLYSFKPAIPEIFGDGLIQYLKLDFDGNWLTYDTFDIDSSECGKHKVFFKFYTHNNYKCYYYDKTTLDEVTPLTPHSYLTLVNYVGASIVRHYVKKIEEDDNVVNSIEWKDYVVLHSHNTYGNDENLLRPFFELNVSDTPPALISNDSYFIIKMNYCTLDVSDEIIKYPEHSRKEDSFDEDNLYLTCSLECGNKWWNGSTWVSYYTTFKLYFGATSTKHYINKNFTVKNNISYDMGIDATGYAVRVPSSLLDIALSVKPTFTIYHPHKVDKSYTQDAVWLSDIEINVVRPNTNINDPDNKEDESDTEYTNIIDSDFVNELDDVEFKICTNDGKSNNYSSVMLYDSDYSLSYFLDTTYNQATRNQLRQEEHYIYKLVTQYSTPSAILNLNLKNEFKPYSLITDKWLPNKLFIVDSMVIDWEYNKNEIKLIEKK